MKKKLALRKVEISEQASSRQQSQPRADTLHKVLGCSSLLEQLKSGQSHIEVGVACPFQPGWLSDFCLLQSMECQRANHFRDHPSSSSHFPR